MITPPRRTRAPSARCQKGRRETAGMTHSPRVPVGWLLSSGLMEVVGREQWGRRAGGERLRDDSFRRATSWSGPASPSGRRSRCERPGWRRAARAACAGPLTAWVCVTPCVHAGPLGARVRGRGVVLVHRKLLPLETLATAGNGRTQRPETRREHPQVRLAPNRRRGAPVSLEEWLSLTRQGAAGPARSTS